MPQQVSDWFARWTEPPRLRSRHAALEHFQRNASWFGIATSPFLRDWYEIYIEPERQEIPHRVIPRDEIASREKSNYEVEQVLRYLGVGPKR